MGLLGRISKKVDKGLDEIFKSSAGPSSLNQPSKPDEKRVSLKRKTETLDADKISKKSRGSDADGKRRKSDKEKKGGRKSHDSVEEENEEDESASENECVELENAHVASDSTSEDDAPVPEHESLTKSNRRKRDAVKKAKYVPESETREQRNARSVFVGNLPVQVVTSRPLAKQLRRHILSHIPSANIESIRFRSVAFQNPTSALDLDADESTSAKQQRQQKRTADWRDQSGGSKKDNEEAAENKKGEKTYLTPAQKRRLAAIKGDLHAHTGATTNAYIVFAHPIPHGAGSNVPRKEVMDPFDAAREAVKKCDGTQFADHTIRVDLVRKAAGDLEAKAKEGDGGALTDPKLSVFVGNLDFASGEDEVRAFFEKVMCEERGKPDLVVKADAGNDEDEEDEEEEDEEQSDEEKTKAEGKQNADVLQKPTWVTRVRVVRDRETQLGKGFAYVQFSDRNCVDEVLAVEPEKLKFAKRPLRVQRCKTHSGPLTKPKPQQTPRASAGATSAPRSRAAPAFRPVALPKGDPTLGTRLAGLPKESRKEAKATDAARVARRLAKKKARIALEKAGVKDGGGKERVRERKERKGAVNTGRKDGKKRVRSERNVEKRNAKK
ncbi:hypothetical protein DFH11DRAFT_769405 [Phellopilus nigrolimitatus]|nr:hypothetical protein DFH11DRAFT_769405 [Phellopilus nigrolimitatus]